MTQDHHIPAFPATATSVILAGATALGVLAAVAALLLSGHRDQVDAAWITAVVCLIAAVIAQMPVRWLSTQAPEGAAQGFLIGLIIRMLICAAAVLVLPFVSKVGQWSAGLWTVAWYVMLLGLEVVLLGRYLLRRDIRLPPASPTENAT